MVLLTRIFQNLDLGIEWLLSYGARTIKVHSKTSWKSPSGKTKVCIIFIAETVPPETLEKKYIQRLS